MIDLNEDGSILLTPIKIRSSSKLGRDLSPEEIDDYIRRGATL